MTRCATELQSFIKQFCNEYLCRWSTHSVIHPERFREYTYGDLATELEDEETFQPAVFVDYGNIERLWCKQKNEVKFVVCYEQSTQPLPQYVYEAYHSYRCMGLNTVGVRLFICKAAYYCICCFVIDCSKYWLPESLTGKKIFRFQCLKLP